MYMEDSPSVRQSFEFFAYMSMWKETYMHVDLSHLHFMCIQHFYPFAVAPLAIEELGPDSTEYKRIRNALLSTIFHTNKLQRFKIGTIYEIFNPKLQKQVSKQPVNILGVR